MVNRKLHDYLDKRFRPCGLNADFWCCTWLIATNIYICDFEDDTFHIIKTGAGKEDITLLISEDVEEIKTFIEDLLVNNKYV